MRWGTTFGILGLAACIAASCNSVETSTCTPGQSIVCGGPDGCSGFQVCRSDGAAYDACMCGSGSSSSTNTGSATTSATTGGGGSGSSTSATSSASQSSSYSSATGSGGALPFSPLDLPGLVLWLDPDQGVVEDPTAPGTMLKWQDQSPNHFIATVTSGGGHLQIDPVAINGHNAFVCHNRLTIEDDPALNFGTGDFGIALVVKPSIGNSTIFWQKNETSNPGTTQFKAPDYFFQVGGGGGPQVAMLTPNPNKFHAIILRGPSVEMFADGMTATGGTSTGDLSSPLWPLWMCIDSGTGAEIAEVIAVKGTLSNAHVASLQGYFSDKFGL